jgi:hypothetical protein
MMLLLLLIAGGVGYWAWKTRDSQAMRVGDVAAVDRPGHDPSFRPDEQFIAARI